jgi:hypothetical protein
MRLYKLSPIFHWTAGGYLWPADHAVVIANEEMQPMQSPPSSGYNQNPRSPRRPQGPPGPHGPHGPQHGPHPHGGVPPVQGVFNDRNGYPDSEAGSDGGLLRARVEESGAIPLADADIIILADQTSPEPLVGKERVYFVSGNDLEKLVVNALVVAFIP